MKTHSILTPTLILVVIISCSSAASSAHNFLECLSHEFKNYSSISNSVHTPTNSSYSSILRSSTQNLRFASDSTPKPLVVITPEHESQIPPIIYCAKESGIQIRTRSGGHDYEGLSYVSQVPFMVVDLINLSEITVDVEEKTAWVGAGATIGSLYYSIAEKSPVLGFPADNVIDSRIIDVNGRILDRKSMGEDLFWSIRGGGGASFGVIVAWKVQLVDVPETVTVFTMVRTLEQNATQLIHRWQYIAPKMDKDLFIGININGVRSTQQGKSTTTIHASFFSLFLGGIDRLLSLMQESFPELGLVREDCAEVSWIQSVVCVAGFPSETPPQALLNRANLLSVSFKGKSNYVQEPMPESGFEGIWRMLQQPEAVQSQILMAPYGGRMAEIAESALPFPHRAGNLYEMLHTLFWVEDDNRDSDKYISWTRRLDDYLTPYVSRDPRKAYLNLRDLDLGVNKVDGETSYTQASIWGKRYFDSNFDRLVRVKTAVDPDDFFRNEQSIPPLHMFSCDE
ncbi:hypothetical protein C2S51_007587 [Perilla frutescens var. frutescens]|nr:hypothetical protein C2S51_007587 [Perilla frutescens var. frutescens]